MKWTPYMSQPNPLNQPDGGGESILKMVWAEDDFNNVLNALLDQMNEAIKKGNISEVQMACYMIEQHFRTPLTLVPKCPIIMNYDDQIFRTQFLR